MTPEYDELITRTVDRVGIVTLNRPQKRNSLSPHLLFSLHKVLSRWAQEDELRAVVIKGEGERAFSSGYDISAIPTNLPPEMAEILKTQNPLAIGLQSIQEFPYPVIAMMNGYAFGAGLNLAMCCDIRIAADTITVGMPPARLGVVYHPDGLKQFVQVLGMATTREVFFTARNYRGAELLSAGFVNRLVPLEMLETTVLDTAKQIAANAPLSLRGMKTILNMMKVTAALDEEDRQQAEAIVKQSFASKDLVEGQSAFLEKRPPVFSGE